MVGGMQVLLVLLLIGYSQEQGSDEVDCVSREEFGRVTAEIDRVDARLQGIKDELDMGQKGIVDILSQLQTDVQDIHSTINNNSLLHDKRQQVLLQGVAQNTSLIQLADKVEEICDNIHVGALQHTELEEQLGEITQELSEIKANQHTSLTQLSDQLSDQVQEIHDNSALQHTDLEEQLGGITQEQANQHTSLTELLDQVQEIRDNSALRHTNAEEQLREITRELSQIKATQHTSLTELSDEIQEIRDNSALQHTDLEEQWREITRELSVIKANQYINHVSGTFQNPAPSCHYTNIPAGSRSGYYYIQSSSAGNGAIRVYCDMTRRCCCSRGGWMRVAQIYMTNPFQSCPSGFRLRTSPKRSCGRPGSGCVSTTFPVYGVQYSRVCGRVRAYQYSSPDAFGPYYTHRHRTIDDLYVDGVSLTHGQNPRKHIWTFAAAVDETQHGAGVCPCTKTDTAYTGVVPPFIGQDYFCDTGSRNQFHYIFYSNNPLWDGAGCGATSTCCSFNNPPWFCKQLPQPTTDDIELRLCGDESLSNEDIGMEIVELYVR